MYFFNIVRHHIIFIFITKWPMSSFFLVQCCKQVPKFEWSVIILKPFTFKCMCTLQTWNSAHIHRAKSVGTQFPSHVFPWAHMTWPNLGVRSSTPCSILLCASSNKLVEAFLHITTPNMIFSVTYYLELWNAIIVYCASQFFYQPWSNWFFGQYRIVTSLDGK